MRTKTKSKQRRFKFSRDLRSTLKKERRKLHLAKKRTCPRIKNLERECSDLTALDVVNLLIDEFHLDKAQIVFRTGRRITITELHGILNDSKTQVSPSQISPIQFFGGPPTDLSRKFTGSILTMLMDRVLYLNASYGSYADLVTP